MRGHAGGAAFIRVRSSSLPLPSLPCPACRPSPFSAARDSRVRPHFATTMMTMRMMTTRRKNEEEEEEEREDPVLFAGSKWHDVAGAQTELVAGVRNVCNRDSLPPSERPTGAILRKCTRQLKAEPLPKGLSDVLSRRFSISISSSFSFSSSSSSPPSSPPFSLSSYSLSRSLARSVYFPVADAASPRSIFLLVAAFRSVPSAASSDASTACGSSVSPRGSSSPGTKQAYYTRARLRFPSHREFNDLFYGRFYQRRLTLSPTFNRLSYAFLFPTGVGTTLLNQL